MIRAKMLYVLLAATVFGIANPASAQPRIGEKVPEFNLQSTTGTFYGVDHTKEQVSVLFFVGYS